tara:strand:- start:249 stop:431 length:183 start_codon:yes stop_codon:yes gene_type:complete
MYNRILKLQTLCILQLNHNDVIQLKNSNCKNIFQFIMTDFWQDIGNYPYPVSANLCSLLL